MHARFCLLLLSCFFAATLAIVPAWSQTALIYATNAAGDNIHAIDPQTNKVIQIISGIEAAHGIAFAPDGSRVYVSNESDSTLDVFDQKTGALIKKVALSAHPNNIAVTKDGGRIVVGIAREPGALDIIDAATLIRTNSVPVQGRLHNVYVTPDNKYVITGSTRSKILTVIDLATEKPVWALLLDRGIRPMTIESNPDGSTRRIFVQLSQFNGFAVVDFAQQKEVQRIALPDLVVDIEKEQQRDSAPSHGMGVSPDNKTLWVTSIPNNAVFAYSLADLSLIGTVPLPVLELADKRRIGAVPNWVTFTPDGKRLYVSNAAQNSISVIDTQAAKLIGTVAVGQVPKRINTLVMR